MNFGGNADQDTSLGIMHRACEAGLTFWDTANVYGAGRSEEIIGAAMKEMGCRDQIIIATKVHGRMGDGPNDGGLSRRHILQQLDASLKRLQTDWIDLYQLHRPVWDTPMEETISTLDDCVRAGKIRYWGTSTFPGWKLAEAWWVAVHNGWERPASEQAPYNILDRRIEQERLQFIETYDWGLIPWSPLAGGILAGKYDLADLENPPEGSRLAWWGSGQHSERITAQGVRAGTKVNALTAEVGCTPAQFALAWLLAQPAVTAPIIGPSRVEQLEDNLPALDLTLDDAVLAAVDDLVPPGTALVNYHNNTGWYVGQIHPLLVD
jgi:aryl-alcohol dehydrogenase-like predicted oxidoreductase